MSIDGLRAWIGEVERKLTMRTRVFLVLAVIAIGVAGAAIYLSQDARSHSVSESDVQALQQQLEGQIQQAATGGTDLSGLEAEVAELRAKVRKLSGEGGRPGAKGGAEPRAGAEAGGAGTK